jgi:putative flippase GtrA
VSPLLRQGASYVVIGLLQLALDALLFVALTAAGMTPAFANPLARASAAGLGFWLNGRHTFADDGGPRLGTTRLWRYAITWGSLTILSTLAVSVAARHLGLHAAWLAKPVIEAVLAVVSFTVMRQWVYRQ